MQLSFKRLVFSEAPSFEKVDKADVDDGRQSLLPHSLRHREAENKRIKASNAEK